MSPEAFTPLDLDTVLTPDEIERHLRSLFNELAFAQLALQRSRNQEVDAEECYSRAKLPLLLDDKCPDPTKSGVTKAAQEEWINARIPDPYWAFRRARVARQQDEDHARRLDAQVRVLQSINAIARKLLELAGSRS